MNWLLEHLKLIGWILIAVGVLALLFGWETAVWITLLILGVAAFVANYVLQKRATPPAR